MNDKHNTPRKRDWLGIIYHGTVAALGFTYLALALIEAQCT